MNFNNIINNYSDNELLDFLIKNDDNLTLEQEIELLCNIKDKNLEVSNRQFENTKIFEFIMKCYICRFDSDTRFYNDLDDKEELNEKLDFIFENDLSDSFSEEFKKRLLDNEKTFNCHIIAHLDDDSKKLEYLNNKKIFKNIEKSDVVDIISSLKSDDLKVDIIKNDKYLHDVYHDLSNIILSINDFSKKEQFLVDDKYLRKLGDYGLLSIINKIKDDSLKEKILMNDKAFYYMSYYILGSAISGFNDDNKKVELLMKDKVLDKLDSLGISYILVSLKDDNLKIKLLKDDKIFNRLEDSTNIIKSISDDNVKVKILQDDNFIDKFNSDELSNLLCSLKDNDIKEKFLLDDEILKKLSSSKISPIINSFNDDNKKIEILKNNKIYNLLDDLGISDVLKKLDNDLVKINLLDEESIKNKDELNFNDILSSIKDENLKLKLLKDSKYFNKISGDGLKNIISSLSSDNIKVQLLEDDEIFSKINGRNLKSILASLKDDKLKVDLIKNNKFLNKLDSIQLEYIYRSIKSENERIEFLLNNNVVNILSDDDLYLAIRQLKSDKYIYEFLDNDLYLNKINSSQLCSIFKRLRNNEDKIKFISNEKVINRIENDDFRETLINLEDDNLKKEIILKYNNRNEFYYNVNELLISISDDNIKEELLLDDKVFKICKSFGLGNIISSFSDDKRKLDEFNKLKIVDSSDIEKIISSLDDDKTKENLIRNDEYRKALKNTGVSSVLISLKDDNQKINLLNEDMFFEMFTYNDICNILSSVEDDNLKIEQLMNDKIFNRVTSDGVIYILTSIKDDNRKIELMMDDRIINLLDGNKLVQLQNSFTDYNNDLIDNLKNNNILHNKLQRRLEDEEFLNSILNIRNMSAYKEIAPFFDKTIGDVLLKCCNSNSSEIEHFGMNIMLPFIVNNKDYDVVMNKFREIESIYLKNNIPDLGKVFLCFQSLYPDFSKKNIFGNELFDFTNNRIAPQLSDEYLLNIFCKNNTDIEKEKYSKSLEFKKRATTMRFVILFNDLLRISVGSNNRSLVDYLDNIEKGNELYINLRNGNLTFDNLSIEQQNIINTFITHLEVLYNNTKNGRENKLSLEDKTTSEKLDILYNSFNPNSKYDLPDRIVRSFCYFAGYDSFAKLKNKIDKVNSDANLKGINNANKIKDKTFKLEVGDFIRCIGSIDNLNCLNSGNLCKELLGTFIGTSDSDTTPLDTDWSRILEEDIGNNINDTISGTPTGFGFGDIYYVIKNNNPNIIISRDVKNNLTGAEYDFNKPEMFRTGYESHWGSRTGNSISEVDYIIINNNNSSDLRFRHFNKKLSKVGALKYELAKNGVYVPIINMDGKLIYTVDEYNNIRDKMSGLSYYHNPIYKISENSLDLPNLSLTFNNNVIDVLNTEEVIWKIKNSEQDREEKNKAIFNTLEKFIKEQTNSNEVYSEMTGDLTEGTAELLGIGSTARGTNIPGDSDFDYILRLDKVEWDNWNRLINTMKRQFKPKEIVPGRGNRFRGKGINTIVGYEDEDFDIDVTFINKTNKLEYSTERALLDKLNSIKEQYPDDYLKIKANIIIAKKLFKDAGVYKSEKSDVNQGGLGGVGIENWILQNGGSLEQAANEFLNIAKYGEDKFLSFDDFKEKYQLWDFGANHESRFNGYLYDDFVALNMSSSGYNKMCNLLDLYVKKLEEVRFNSYENNIFNR